MENVDRLPDAYDKNYEHNNYKMLKLNSLQCSDLILDIQDVYNSLDLNLATGKTLDLYGESVGLNRGNFNDEQYRIAILNKIAYNTSVGEYENVVWLLSLILGSPKNEIEIRDSPDEICKVEVRKIPLSKFLDSGFTLEDLIYAIETLLPICIKVSSVSFEGTFEFDEFEYIYDIDKGFGNEEQTVGGYLGLFGR